MTSNTTTSSDPYANLDTSSVSSGTCADAGELLGDGQVGLSVIRLGYTATDDLWQWRK